ncbi:MAG: hypothetical protein V1858_03950 [Candidatus Gottesmanbacteria bacterium]
MSNRNKIIIFVICFLILTLAIIGNNSLKRKFLLTDNHGIVYFDSVVKKPLAKIKQNQIVPENDLKSYIQLTNKSFPFTFYYPKTLLREDSDLNVNLKISGFEEYFTLPPILAAEAYSYPGKLGNPEKTENNWTTLLRVISCIGDSKNIELWLDDFYDKDSIKNIITVNGNQFIQYEKLFGQKLNKILIANRNGYIAMIMLSSNNSKDFLEGEKMLNIIINTFKWIK